MPIQFSLYSCILTISCVCFTYNNNIRLSYKICSLTLIFLHFAVYPLLTSITKVYQRCTQDNYISVCDIDVHTSASMPNCIRMVSKNAPYLHCVYISTIFYILLKGHVSTGTDIASLQLIRSRKTNN